MNLRILIVMALLVGTWPLTALDAEWIALWPSAVALIAVFLLNRAITGLLCGSAAGLLLIHGGNPFEAFVSFFADRLIPALADRWNISVLLFTLMLGGFAAVLERGGGMRALTERWIRGSSRSGRRVQWSAYGLGLICFFDGLANSMLVGKSFAPLADRAGVSRKKLAYIVDSTSSAVACVAVISTWIAYQLAMIREGLAGAEGEPAPFGLFLKSIPYNYYCWFTLVLLAVVIAKNWNIGPMRSREEQLR